MKIAILTGASSGLGREYLRLLAAREELDQIWAIARREERLRELCALSPEKIVPLAWDLCAPGTMEALSGKLADERPEVEILINNAGVGSVGEFIEMSPESQRKICELNVTALTEATNRILPFMGKGGCVVNVCSIAAFAPNTRMAVYCSSKAYVQSFSKCLRRELKGRGINVMAVCPGPMNTEFFEASDAVGRSVPLESGLPRCCPKRVAERSLSRALRGKGFYTPRFFYKLYRLLAKLLPHSFIMNFSGT